METTIKWYGDWPYGWYVEQSDEIECVSNNNLGIHYGWVLTKLNKTDEKEVFFKKFLHVTVLGYREIWKHNNETNIATRVIQYAVVTPYTRHKTLPFVVLETESLYAPVLFRELQRQKRGLDFFRELGDEQAWQELITCAKEADSTYSEKYLNYTFYSNKTPLFTYYFVLSSALTRVPVIELASVPKIKKFGFNFYRNSIRGKEWEELEEATSVAKQHGFLTEFPREHGIGVVDFQDIDWSYFSAFE